MLVYVAHSLNGDIRTLEGVAMKLVALKNLQGVRLDKAVVDGLLKEVADDNEQSTRPPQGGRALPVGFEFSPGTALNRDPSDVATESALGEEQVSEGEVVTPRRVNPLVQEFSRAAPLARKLATPNEVASAVPQAVSRYVIVLGTSGHLVTNTVEAMVGRGSHHVQSSEGAPWAYMVHLECDDPHWVLVGTTHWDREAKLTRTVTSHQPPAFVVVLDGENPEIANAKELISSVPRDGGMAVVVLGSFLSDSSDALRKMLRRLLGVPPEFPVLVQGGVDTPGSRTWVKLALESRRAAARCEAGDQPAVSSGSQ